MSRILFKKEGRAKYISHLDIMRTMQRIFIRAGVRIKHTEGFNPHPYMAFALPLPVGTESDCELMDFELVGGAELEELPERLTRFAPEGITVLAAYEEERKFKHLAFLRVQMVLEYDGGVPEGAPEELRELYSRSEIIVEKTSKGKTRQEDIAPLIKSAEFDPRGEREIVCTAVLAAQNPGLSPALMLSAIEACAPHLAPDFVHVRRLEVYDSEMKTFR